MRLEDALTALRRPFLDTAPVIYFVERNPAYIDKVDPFFTCLNNGTMEAVISPVTLAECLVAPCRLQNLVAQQAFVALLTGGPGVIFQVTQAAIAHRAAELRAKYKLGLPDAVQIATALATSCDAVLTNDMQLKPVTEISILILDELTLNP
jgi:predicted nucleic acid-binding protein